MPSIWAQLCVGQPILASLPSTQPPAWSCTRSSCISLPAGAYPFQITVTKTYNITNLFDDIKALYKIAGYKGQPVAFIFTDSEVKEEGFLEYINQVGHQLAQFCCLWTAGVSAQNDCYSAVPASVGYLRHSAGL